MSRFLERLVDSAARSTRGMTTGEPGAPERRTWSEVHERARRMAGG